MPGPFFGAASGQVSANGGVQPLINGLTISPSILVTNAVASQGIVYLGDSFVTTAKGYPLEPGKSITLETGGSLNRWYVTTDGTTARVSWIATPAAGNNV